VKTNLVVIEPPKVELPPEEPATGNLIMSGRMVPKQAVK
jgi:hypothetical protein